MVFSSLTNSAAKRGLTREAAEASLPNAVEKLAESVAKIIRNRANDIGERSVVADLGE